jgi:hypothetical protein
MYTSKKLCVSNFFFLTRGESNIRTYYSNVSTSAVTSSLSFDLFGLIFLCLTFTTYQ